MKTSQRVRRPGRRAHASIRRGEGVVWGWGGVRCMWRWVMVVVVVVGGGADEVGWGGVDGVR